MSIKRLAGLTVVGLAMWAGIAWAVLGSASAEDSTVVVPCPTEDSCSVDYVIAEYRRITGDTSASPSVDYHDGAYHITPVVP